jgi:hypothetical protein
MSARPHPPAYKVYQKRRVGRPVNRNPARPASLNGVWIGQQISENANMLKEDLQIKRSLPQKSGRQQHVDRMRFFRKSRA